MRQGQAAAARCVSTALLVMLGTCLGSQVGRADEGAGSDRATLQRRGRDLRSAIEATYAARSRSGTLQLGINEVTPLILAHLPIGSATQDDVEILRAAGLRVDPLPPRPRPPNPPPGFKDAWRFMVFGTADIDRTEFCDVVVQIDLTPSEQVIDASRIVAVRGFLVRSCL